MEDEKSKVAAVRRRRRLGDGRGCNGDGRGEVSRWWPFALDERGGGFALDERAPPCHIFPRTKMPLD